MDLRQKLKLVSRYAIGILGALVVGFLLSYLLIFGGSAVMRFVKTGATTVASAFKQITINSQRAEADLSIPEKISANTTVDPGMYYFIKDPKKKLNISAGAYIVGDLDTGQIILKKDENKQYSIASVSKLMTALLSKENYQPTDLATVSARALDTYGQNGGFKVNEKLKISDLYYPLLLQSSNDAAEVLAEQGGPVDFIAKMNSKAKALGMTDTIYRDPSGLSPYNASTASDLFKLVSDLYKNHKDILDTTKTPSYKITGHYWQSNNQFLRQTGYLGGKSGYTDLAKETVVSLFNAKLSDSAPRNVAIILLQSSDRFKDATRVLQHLKDNIHYGAQAPLGAVSVIPAEPEPEVTLAFTGDIMLDRGVKKSVQKNFGGDYAALFQNLEFLKEKDLWFTNLEGPASDKGTDLHNLYSFRMDPEVLPVLKNAGLDIVSFANNHVGDWGYEAFTDTLDRLKENEILYAGAGKDKASAEAPTIIERNGIRVGFLGFSDVGPNNMETTDNRAGILLANDPRLSEIIATAAKQVDQLVVSFHWGDEYKKFNERQTLLAHRAIDAGARLVIGHHPHVMQDIEIYKDGLIAYSLGNFIFDQHFSKDTMRGMLLEVTVNKRNITHTTKKIIHLNSLFQPSKVETVK